MSEGQARFVYDILTPSLAHDAATEGAPLSDLAIEDTRAILTLTTKI